MRSDRHSNALPGGHIIRMVHILPVPPRLDDMLFSSAVVTLSKVFTLQLCGGGGALNLYTREIYSSKAKGIHSLLIAFIVTGSYCRVE